MLKKLFAAAGAALAISMAATVASSQPGAAPPSVDAYGALPAIENIELSPDGQNIAFTAAVGPKRAFVVKALNGGATLGATDLAGQLVVDVSWADDTHVIITTTKKVYADRADRQQIYTAQIYNTQTRAFAPILGSSRGTSDMASVRSGTGASGIKDIAGPPRIRTVDGQPLVTVGSLDRTGKFAVYKIDLATGDGALMDEPYGDLMDENGRFYVRVQADIDTKRWWLETREGAGWRNVLTMTADPLDWPQLIGPGRTAGTVLINVPETDADAIYEVNLATGAKLKLEFEGAGEGEVTPRYQARTQRLIGFSYLVDDHIDFNFIDPQVGRVWAAVQKGFPGKVVTPVSWTPDYSRLVVHTMGAGDSGTYLLVDTATNRAVKLGADYPTITPDQVNEVRFIHYKAADGRDIPAFLTLPRGRDPHNLPLIVMPHGGPQSRDYPGFDWWSQAIASRGYVVLQPQYRGSDGFGLEHIRAGYGQWGKLMQTDLSDGVRYLAGQGLIDPKRVCINGWSYGGYAAMAGATLDPGIYRCAVAGAGVSDLPRMMLWVTGGSRSENRGAARYWKRNMGANRVGDPALAQVSPAEFASRVTIPLLLIHGKQDTVVPYEQSEIMARAMTRAGKPFEFVTLENEDHHLQDQAERQKMLNATITFLERNNPPN
jgi:dipeptidyl aminopeptidase/acylaminoacyl peptidase